MKLTILTLTLMCGFSFTAQAQDTYPATGMENTANSYASSSMRVAAASEGTIIGQDPNLIANSTGSTVDGSSSQVDLGKNGNWEAAGPCTSCSEPPATANSSKTLVQQIKTFSLASFISSINLNIFNRRTPKTAPPICEQFSNGDDLGPWGKTIVVELNSGRYPDLMRGSSDLKELCPAYDTEQMTDLDRESLWVVIINGMAARESTCDPRAQAKGPNGTLKGILQLHMGHETQYGAKDCVANASSDVHDTLICALSMLDNHLSKGEDLFSKKDTYWQTLFPNEGPGKEIMSAIKAFPPCTLH